MAKKKLIIVESSSKCGSIETYLGANYKCISCNGHIRCINDLKSIDTANNFETLYTVDPDKKAHISKMLSVVSTFAKENIILATDHDREGEAIAWHICEVFDLPVETTNRILFHEVTKTALLKAIENPRIIDMNMVRAQQARQVLDLLVGFSISPLLWKYVNNNALSAGRCQTPALRLIYENEMESKDKTERVIHKVNGCFFPQNLIFELEKEFETEGEVNDFLHLSTRHDHKFVVYPQKLSERSPPKPFNTASLLQSVNNTIRIGAKETMACCQTLYQMGHITYMRTENRKYSPIFIDVVSKYISGKWTEKHVHSNLLELHGNNDSNNPHEAIRVTNVNMRDIILIGDKNTNAIEKVYKLIWQNTVQSCMSPAIFNTLPMEIDAPNNNRYKHTLEIPKFNGFLDLLETPVVKCSPELFSSMSMRIQSSKIVNYNYIQSIVGFTNKHSRYSEAGLINKLEDLGIGRPSTFSMLVDIIQTRKYVDKREIDGKTMSCLEYFLRAGDKKATEKIVVKKMGAEHNKLVIDGIGIVTIEFLLKHFDNLFSYNYTKLMEERLDLVSKGEELWYEVCKDCYKEIKRQIKNIDKLEKKIYSLCSTDSNYVLMHYKNGFLLKQIQQNKTDKPVYKPVYKSVKKDLKIDMERLEAGNYTYEELAEVDDRILGTWNGHEIELKTGKYGNYVEYNDGIKVSLYKLKKKIEEIVLEDVVSYLEKENILRVLSPTLSIRKGKFGAYIFYKTETMKKPKFFDLKKFEPTCDDKTCDEPIRNKTIAETCDKNELIEWITRTYLHR
jgi:DNA topoisomerase-1